uniref:Uncharacterized protein n=1 Tax=Cyprinus carpio TaxID=7962 RepID=A0A8C1T4W4_CYPCA
MICILLVAGHGTILETQIKSDVTGLYAHLTSKILDFWWETLLSKVYPVTNADKYNHYERWATANDFPVENVVNDGSSTTLDDRLGAVADLELAIQSRQLQDGLNGDMLCADQNFDIAQVIRFFRSKNLLYYELDIYTGHQPNAKVMRFLEKPREGITASRLASVVFYCLRKESLQYIYEFLIQHPDVNDRTFGKFWEWLINEEKVPVYGMKLPTEFQLIGQVVGTNVALFWVCVLTHRVGLMGNLSDSFNGKTIAMNNFGSLQDLFRISQKEGFVQSFVSDFYCFALEMNFTLKYDTNIPRAIVSATLKGLLKFYNITDNDLPKPIRANFILSVETDELFITAGLQDRVVQVPLSKAPNPQLLPGRRSINGSPLLRVCVHGVCVCSLLCMKRAFQEAGCVFCLIVPYLNHHDPSVQSQS